MANTHEHLEHAEHAEHHASDPFAQRVAVSMAIVAAILAGISMVGHRTHNKVLQLQGESNRLLGDVNRVIGEANRASTEAGTAETEKSNLFAWYQSKRLRQSFYQISIGMAGIQSGSDDARAKAVADWKKKADEYNDPHDPDSLPNILKRGNEAGKKAEALRAEAAKIREEAATFRQQAREKNDEAEHTHHQADRFDVAHLSAEIGLVLCSIALLTKKRPYWFAGLAAAVVAIALTASAYAIPHDHHDSHGAPSQHDAHPKPSADKGKDH
jgi:hypothetical protein